MIHHGQFNVIRDRAVLCYFSIQPLWLILSIIARFFNNQAGWPNGKALDYGSRDCRFESCVGHSFLFFVPPSKSPDLLHSPSNIQPTDHFRPSTTITERILFLPPILRPPVIYSDQRRTSMHKNPQ
ncbi:hypothetical protein BO78DRAFT_171323 [Aspergillus sclerotiicarbonarius CBS 121057]|uniref:Uncharacterized protein n=1 Tax=Aspergillus sclerotiicarbonarius (strain CBS 121057 / IBT 28362) TaxID=1448318 RepID=A0A319E4T7_ASPSB|nr:hypothetical protein BO78DRAFT_171323 [Aspergillus sclerotiicarbonarius CBS 121057]